MAIHTFFTRSGWCVALVALVGLGACSLVLEPDEKQCKKSSECAPPYVCGSAGFCERQSGCETDANCRQPGICSDGTCEKPECALSEDCADAELCNKSTMRCVRESQASCKTSADCAAFDGANVCLRSEERCAKLECVKKSDCGTSPTVSCTKGSCEDPQWGCLGQPDERPAPSMSEEGSLEIKVLYIFPKQNELETGVNDLNVRVCQFSDNLCTTTVTDDVSYLDNVLTIRGLENRKNYRIRLQANHPTNGTPLLEAEYQMYRTVVGKTVDPRPLIMFEPAFRAQTAAAAGVTVDEKLGLVLAYTLDCESKEVAGVSISVDKLTVGCGGESTCATTAFYFTASNLPDPGSTQTSLAGRLGIVNLVPEVSNRLTLTRTADNKKITSFLITPRPNVVTYTYFYPDSFGTSAD